MWTKKFFFFLNLGIWGEICIFGGLGLKQFICYILDLKQLPGFVQVSLEACNEYISNKPTTTPESCCKLELWQINCFWHKMPKYGNFILNPQLLKIFIFFGLDRCISLTLPTSPQQPLKVVANSNSGFPLLSVLKSC